MISLEKLSEIISSDIDRLILALDIKVRKSFRSYCGACPIHNGNPHSLSIYERDGIYRWHCHSANCHSIFNNSLIGLTQAIFSVRQEGWEHQGDKLYHFGKTINYLKDLYRVTNKDLTVTEDYLEKKSLSPPQLAWKVMDIEYYVHENNIYAEFIRRLNILCKEGSRRKS